MDQPAPDVSGTQPAKKKMGMGIAIGAVAGIVVLVLCLGGGGLVAGLVFGLSGSPAKDVLSRIPADAMGVLLVRDLAGLHRAYGTDQMLESMSEEEREFFEKMLERETDLEPDLLTELLGNIKLDGVAGVSVALVDDDRTVGCFVIPVRDGDAVVRAIEDFADEQRVDLDTKDHDGHEYHVDEDDVVAFTASGGHLLLVIHDDFGAEDYMEDLLDGKLGSAWSEDWVTSVKSELGGDWHAMVLLNPDLPRLVRNELVREFDLEAMESELADRLDETEGLGATLYVGAGEWRIDAFMAVEDGADWLEGSSGATKDTLAKHVGGDAVAVVRSAMNAEQWLEQTLDVPDAGDEIQETMRALRREIGIDVEDDVVPFLGSPVTVAVFDSESGEIPYSFVGWIPLTKGHEMDDVLEDVEDALQEQRIDIDTDKEGDTTWYVVEEGEMEVAWAVVRGHFVVGAGRNRIRDLQDQLESSEGSFLDGISSSGAKKALGSGADSVGYVDIEAFVDQFADELQDDRDTVMAWPLLDSMSAAFGTAEIDGRIIRGSVSLVAAEPEGFADAIYEIGGGDGGFGNTPMVLQSKRAEGAINLDAIRTAEKAYHAEWDAYTTCRATPASVPGREAVPFDGAGLTSFHNLGWTSDGDVRCRYSVEAVDGRRNWQDRFVARAECDVDGDGVYAVFEATHRQRSTMVTDPGIF